MGEATLILTIIFGCSLEAERLGGPLDAYQGHFTASPLSATRWQSQHSDGPACSREKTLLFPNCSGASPSQWREVALRKGRQSDVPEDPRPRQPGSRTQMLPFAVTHSPPRNRAALSISLSEERDRDKMAERLPGMGRAPARLGSGRCVIGEVAYPVTGVDSFCSMGRR